MVKKLGQHFLFHKPTLGKIADALELKEGDVVIEIGPGHGELTEQLKIESEKLRVKIKIFAIEKDGILADALKEKFHMNNRTDKTRGKTRFTSRGADVEIIEGDALSILPSLITQLHNYPVANYKIAGNIPYYITGYLFRILGELRNKPSRIVLLIQKEVAERVCAVSPRMNLLAASVRFWAEPKIIARVPRGYFRPPPKVQSAVITLTPISADLTRTNADGYYKFIRILFKQPRKTILNNLAAGIENTRNKGGNKEKLAEILKKNGISPGDRPQDLSLERIVELAKAFPGD